SLATEAEPLVANGNAFFQVSARRYELVVGSDNSLLLDRQTRSSEQIRRVVESAWGVLRKQREFEHRLSFDRVLTVQEFERLHAHAAKANDALGDDRPEILFLLGPTDAEWIGIAHVIGNWVAEGTSLVVSRAPVSDTVRRLCDFLPALGVSEQSSPASIIDR